MLAVLTARLACQSFLALTGQIQLAHLHLTLYQ